MRALFLCLLAAVAAADRPNLLLVVVDDMGYGDLSCYGSLQVETPNLDRLAANGVRCTDGYVSSSVCAPSRAGLMTGRSGSRFGFEHNISTPDQVVPAYTGIPLDEVLLPQRLKDLGYRTGLVGKWHLGHSVPEQHPLERGFDTFLGVLKGSHAYWPTVEKNDLLRGREKPEEVRAPYLTDWFTLEALDFVDAGGDEPWFLFLSYNTPHGPMQAKEEDRERFGHVRDDDRRSYCAMQHCMDQGLGRIVARLKERGELENTLIWFLSDNGGSVEVSHAINAPLRGTKGTFLEGGIRVPMIVHWPARLGPSVYERPVSALDVMATFVTAAGGAPPKKEGKKIYDSVDLVPYFRGEAEGDPHEALYWRTALRGAAIRQGDWKLLIPSSQPPTLYDLSTDISEQHDLILEHPEVARRLRAQLNRWEVKLERNPLFISAPRWLQYNRRLYAKTFTLTQPPRDDDGDHWSFEDR